MPLARYFLFVGGVLVALLLVSGWLLPKLPTTETAEMGADKDMAADKSSFLRISSDRKWPERVVFDTSVAPIAPVQTAMTEEAVTPPARDAVADVSARVRDAFAQLAPSDQKNPDQKKAESKPHPKRKIAKKHLAPPRVLVAQQPRFGLFVSNTW